ncbi:MAG: hypothetical protein COU27_00265 [Candidatus Levybacteria bacterium CG10_big_fil_rev_8_21_14_0_10_36_7]|nr:MAG: hypothetical protein COU27_00265 [Candidatus Levybacteria bacterium CG10_big_fil_rev_8_21_14_0_10_36_7]
MSSLNKIGFFSEDFFSYYEDADLGWRIWLLGYECMLSSGSVVYHKYDFSRSTKSYFYMERNRYIMIFQNYKIRTLFFLSPALFLMEIFTLARSFMNRYWIVRLKMYNYFLDLENWKKILYNKKVIFAQRVASDKEIFAKMSGKISYQESAGVLILYIVNPFLSLYYRLVLKILIW